MINCTSNNLMKGERLRYSILWPRGSGQDGEWNPQPTPALSDCKRADVLQTRHLGDPAYRACVAGAAICIVRIVAPREPTTVDATSARPRRNGRREPLPAMAALTRWTHPC